MPLVVSTLQSQLQSLFATPGPDYASCAQGWASAMGAYAAAIVPPSTTVPAAASALSASLASAFATPNAIPGMESAFAQFAATVGLGMVGYAPVPPPAPVGFAAQFGGPVPSTHAEAASSIATRVDAWMRTGVSTLVAPPNTPVPWS